jgi:hypothetical protein
MIDSIIGPLLAAATFVGLKLWNPYFKGQSKRAFLEAAAVALFVWFMWWGAQNHANYCDKHPHADSCQDEGEYFDQ